MIKIYLDCELTHLPAYPHKDIPGTEPGLVSIGCVSECDKTFYAENADVDKNKINDFVSEIIMPLLDGGDALMPYPVITEKLKAWLESFGEDVQLQMLTDAPYVDWPPVLAMFEMYGWPCNLIKEPQWLWLDDGLVDNLFIQNPVMRRHHALDDALMNKLADKAPDRVDTYPRYNDKQKVIYDEFFGINKATKE